MNYSFTVLHISDLHARGPHEEGWRRNRVLGESWRSNLTELIKEARVDLVTFTGDLANGGKAEEYSAAGRFLDEVLDSLGLSRKRLFLIPGNHDIDRERSDEAKEAWRALRKKLAECSEPELQEASRWLAGRRAPPNFDDTWRDCTLSRQDSYRAFLREIGRTELLPENSAHKHLGYRQTLRLPGHPFDIHIVGLDSAWLAGDDSDVGKLRLTEDQVMKLCTDDQGNSLSGFRLALVHHPLTELADGPVCRRHLAEQVDLLLRGHLHKTVQETLSDPERSLHELAAGCLYEGHRADQWRNSCLLLQVNCDERGRPQQFVVRFRSFSPDGGHWHDDSSIYRSAPHGRLTIELPGTTTTPNNSPDYGSKVSSAAITLKPPLEQGQPITQLPPRNRYFKGRSELLASIQNTLQSQRGVVLTGLGGIGKSQLVLAVGHLAADSGCPLVWWIDARPPASIELQLIALARKLQLPQVEKLEPENAISALRSYLQMAPSWLLIVDGVSDFQNLGNVIPDGNCGRVLVTTRRSKAILPGLPTLKVPPLAETEAVEFLLKRSQHNDLPTEEHEAAGELVRELGGLPLALEQAALDLQAHSALISSYLQEFRRDGVSRLRRSAPAILPNHPAGNVQTVWEAEFTDLRSRPASHQVLVICSLWPMDFVRAGLFVEGAFTPSESLHPWLSNQPLDELLEPLLSTSMMNRDTHPEFDLVSVHPLVRAVICASLKPDERAQLVQRVARTFPSELAQIEIVPWPLVARMWPALRTLCYEVLQPASSDEGSFARLMMGTVQDSHRLCDVACALLRQQSYQREEALELIEARRQLYLSNGSESSQLAVAKLWNRKAELQYSRGDYQESLRSASSAREIIEKINESHDLTMRQAPVDDLSYSLVIQSDSLIKLGLHTEAVKIMVDRLDWVTPGLRSDRQTELSILSLGKLCRELFSQGLFVEADSYAAQLLAIWDDFFLYGYKRDVVDAYQAALQTLADGYQDQRRYGRAAELLEFLRKKFENITFHEFRLMETLVALRELYGSENWQRPSEHAQVKRALKELVDKVAAEPDHYSAAQLATLAYACEEYSQVAELLALARAADTRNKRQPDPNYLYRFAQRMRADNWEEAERLFEEHITNRKLVLRPGHPQLARLQRTMAELYSNVACTHKVEQGQVNDIFKKAEQTYKTCLALFEETYLPVHVEVIDTLHGLAELARQQGFYSPARQALRQVQVRYERAYGKQHPQLAEVYEELATVELEAGQLADAADYCRRVLALRSRYLSEQHPWRLDTEDRLAAICQAQGDLLQARDLLSQSLAKRKVTWGGDHPLLNEPLTQIFTVCVSLGKLTEAQEYRQHSLMLHNATYGEGHAASVDFHCETARIYQDAQQPDAAKEAYLLAVACSAQLYGIESVQHATLLNRLGADLDEAPPPQSTYNRS